MKTMKLANLFSDNMILQRDRPVPVWGWGKPGERVTVEFAGQKKTAITDTAGKWLVTLDPLPVSTTPRELSAGDCRIKNVLVGDVWLCSGQSNMEWSVANSNNAKAEIAAAKHPQLRLFTVPTSAVRPGPQPDIAAAWQVCTPAAIAAFSAVGYFFGRELLQQTGVPTGLINCAWGGTRIETWMSRAALLTDAVARHEVETIDRWCESAEGQAMLAEFEKSGFDLEWWEHKVYQSDPGNTGFAHGWAAPDHADRTWPVMEIPQAWQLAGQNFSGVFWFRREVDVPAAWAGQELVLHLGTCDKTDTTYFNGTQVGAIGFEMKNSWSVPRVYRIPGNLVRAGRNVIATRVFSNIYQGGLTGPAADMQLVAANQPPVKLAGPWRYQVEHNFGLIQTILPPPGGGNPNSVCTLYESMLTPVAPVALRGFIWYQGESNVSNARNYRQLFPLMIRDWRRTFQNDALPFYFVQIANYLAPQREPVESGWAELREAQTLTLREPHTGMAVAIDIGEANDIHPKNKQDVGQRLARHALAKVHGRPVVCHGPLYRSHRVEGDTIRIEFDYAAGLKTNDGKPVKGFAIAGTDGKFEWAEARIDGATVLVRSDRVREPVAVRYAWVNNPAVNLYNADDLPASPFRTDVD